MAPWLLFTPAMVMWVKVSVLPDCTMNIRTLLLAVSVNGFPPLEPSIVVSAPMICMAVAVMVAGPPQLKVTSPPPESAVSKLPSLQGLTVPLASAAYAPQASTATAAARPKTSEVNRRKTLMGWFSDLKRLGGAEIGAVALQGSVAAGGCGAETGGGGRVGQGGCWRNGRHFGRFGRQNRKGIVPRRLRLGHFLYPGDGPGLDGHHGGGAADNSAHGANIGISPVQLLPFVVNCQAKGSVGSAPLQGW